MPLFEANAPSPERNDIDEHFWQACNAGQLLLPQCRECGRYRHPSNPFCPSCRSTAFDWVEHSGEASLFSFAVVYHATHPAMASAIPYIIATVLLQGADDVRLASNMLDVAPSDLAIGMPLALIWDRQGEQQLPRFGRRH